jgi:hypothetical protein
MSFLTPKTQKGVAVVDPADTENRSLADQNRKIAAGGRSSTFLASIMQPAAGSLRPAATLTGLNG